MSKRSKAKYNKVYNRKNRKQLAKYHKAFYRRNRKKVLKYSKDRYCKNRERLLKDQAAYNRKNRKRLREYQVGYRRKNRKRIIEKAKARYQKNRKIFAKRLAEYAREIRGRHFRLMQRHKRQLAPRGIKGLPMSLEAHRKKLYFANGRERLCWYCFGENNKTGSGLDRLDNNITYTNKNTVPCCRGCDVWRGYTHSVQQTRDHFKPMRLAALAARRTNLNDAAQPLGE